MTSDVVEKNLELMELKISGHQAHKAPLVDGEMLNKDAKDSEILQLEAKYS